MHDVARLVQAEGGLGKVADARRIGQFQMIDIFHGFHQVAAVRHLAQRSDDFVVVLVADQHNAEPVAREAYGFQMDFCDQRTSGVDDVQLALRSLLCERMAPPRGR